MSSFTLPSTDPVVSVKLTSDLSRDQLLAFPAFETWLKTLQHSLSLQKQASHAFHNAPYVLRAIEVQAVDFFGGGRLGFVKLRAEVSNEKGERLPGSIFLRGGSVCMMVRTTRGSEDYLCRRQIDPRCGPVSWCVLIYSPLAYSPTGRHSFLQRDRQTCHSHPATSGSGGIIELCGTPRRDARRQRYFLRRCS